MSTGVVAAPKSIAAGDERHRGLVARGALLLVDAREQGRVVVDDGVGDQAGTLVPQLLLGFGVHAQLAARLFVPARIGRAGASLAAPRWLDQRPAALQAGERNEARILLAYAPCVCVAGRNDSRRPSAPAI